MSPSVRRSSPRVLFCLAAVTFPIANFWLIGPDWAKGGFHTFLIVLLETALVVALSVQVERRLPDGKRKI